MAKIEASDVINCPVGEVFAFATDLDKMAEWMDEIVEIEKASEGPIAVGTTFNAVISFMGRRIETGHEVTAYEDERRFAFKITSGPVRGEITLSFATVEGGTKVTASAEGDSAGILGTAELIWTRLARRQYQNNLAKLKHLMEAEGEAGV
jgi:carbon monoxide dehydrogenase subunit G